MIAPGTVHDAHRVVDQREQPGTIDQRLVLCEVDLVEIDLDDWSPGECRQMMGGGERGVWSRRTQEHHSGLLGLNRLQCASHLVVEPTLQLFHIARLC